jgi:hypothetical protein
MDDSELKLLEGHDYGVSTHGRDGVRFVGLFRRCWDAIPEVDRQTILDYWDRHESRRTVSFELSNKWGDHVQSHAQVREGGYRVRFNAESFSIMPERPALFIIAHELAHVHGWASGKSRALLKSILEANTDKSVALQTFETESDANANALAVQWGFDKVACMALEGLTKARGFESACRMMANAPGPNQDKK